MGLEIKDDYKQGIFLIDVFTEWCGPCKFVRPILEKLNKEGLFKLMAVDLDKNRPLGNLFGITAIPTLLFFKNGELLEKNIVLDGQNIVKHGIMVGALPENILRKIISQV